MKFSNKNLYQLFKDAGLDLATLTFRRQIEIISVYLTWIHLIMEIWSLAFYGLDSVTKSFQIILLLFDGPSE
ncbi:hypothetical protein KR026_008428 [Drosophila bipectinata]|nr:uncharacterized protein LOC122321693 [Drosophila bipectinata]KAH8244402.1 hypothetical protein KR026_008428 [Drosophila bipectinata]